jgi:2-phospho-L-lactate guanylyltransferase
VTPDEVARLIETAGSAGPRPRVVLVPSHDRDGTNAVLAAPPDAFPLSFGPRSFARHFAQAEARGIDCRVVELAGLARDVDEPRDLLALLAAKEGDSAYAFLEAHRGLLRESSLDPRQP